MPGNTTASGRRQYDRRAPGQRVDMSFYDVVCSSVRRRADVGHRPLLPPLTVSLGGAEVAAERAESRVKAGAEREAEERSGSG